MYSNPSTPPSTQLQSLTAFCPRSWQILTVHPYGKPYGHPSKLSQLVPYYSVHVLKNPIIAMERLSMHPNDRHPLLRN